MYNYVCMYVFWKAAATRERREPLDCCSEGRGECVCFRGSGVVMMVKL
jgi:hypothetical protein